MRIGFITTSFPRFKGDPAGSFVFGLARELAARDHRVEVIAPEPRLTPDWNSKATWMEGVRVFGAPYVRPRRLQKLFYGAGVPDNVAERPILAGLVPSALLSLYLRAALRAPRWDGVLSHWLLPSALLVGVLPARRRFTHLALAHSADVHLLRANTWGRVLGRRIVGSADKLGFVSQTLRDEFLSALSADLTARAKERSHIVPMGVRPSDFVIQRSREQIRRELGLVGFTVLFLGRLVPIKGVEVAIEATYAVEDLELIVAGDGPQSFALKEQAQGAQAKVRFLGQVGPHRRAELLKACDAVIVPSLVLPSGRHEGLPLVVCETLAAGRPLVASDTGGIGELVDHEQTGLLVPPGDARALGSALKRLQRDRALARRLSLLGRQRVEERDWSNVADICERLMDR